MNARIKFSLGASAACLVLLSRREILMLPPQLVQFPRATGMDGQLGDLRSGRQDAAHTADTRFDSRRIFAGIAQTEKSRLINSAGLARRQVDVGLF